MANTRFLDETFTGIIKQPFSYEYRDDTGQDIIIRISPRDSYYYGESPAIEYSKKGNGYGNFYSIETNEKVLNYAVAHVNDMLNKLLEKEKAKDV